MLQAKVFAAPLAENMGQCGLSSVLRTTGTHHVGVLPQLVLLGAMEATEFVVLQAKGLHRGLAVLGCTLFNA